MSSQPPLKKQKTEQKFLPRYTSKWSFIVKSSESDHQAFCKVCKKDFHIGRSGEFDIKRHNDGIKHKQLEASAKLTSVSSMFKKSKTAEEVKEEEVKRQAREAELTLVQLIADLNLPIASADKFNEAFKTMFPDSSIAKQFSCARTKATALAKDLAKIHQDKLFFRMKRGPFTLSTDGSNDEKDKLFPVVVRSVNPDTLTVDSELLSLPACDGSATGENIFNLLDAILTTNEIPWSNCIAFGSDNASVMTGAHKGVFSFIKKKNPDCFLAGCTLHLVHIAAEKAADNLPFSPAELLVDIFYYFKKSSVRLQGLSSFQDLHGTDQKKMLKHVSTRWLSIRKCLDRLIENWDPLKSYFQKEKDNQKKASKYAQGKVKTISERLNSYTAKLYTYFLRYASSLFDSFLTANQSSAPRIAKLRNSMLRLLKDIEKQFVKPSAFVGNKLATSVDFLSTYNIKSNSDILIGTEAKDWLAKKKDHFTADKCKDFYSFVLNYYQTVATYLKANLPFEESILLDLAVTDPDNISEDNMSSKMERLVTKFPVLRQGSSGDELINAFAELQTMTLEKQTRDDHTWAKAAQVNPETKPACLVLLGLMTIPHGSAHCERVFSCIRKNRTVFRPSLGLDTLEALMILKHIAGGPLSQVLTDKDKKLLQSSTVRALHAS